MKKLKEYFASHGVGYFLAILAAILTIVSIVLYTKNGLNIYCNAYNNRIYICCWLAFAFLALSLFVDLIPGSFTKELIRPARAVAFLLLLYAALQYILTQAMFLGAVFVAIDVDQYSPLIPGFVATFCCMLLAVIFAILGAGLDRRLSRAKSSEVNS